MNATLEQIWEGFAVKLGGFIRSRVADPTAAEDILQDVFVRIHRGLDRLQEPARLESWIFQITRNAIVDHHRTRRETVEVPETLPAEPAADSGEIADLVASFRRMIDRLPEPYREAVVLTELEGLSQKELATRLGISVSGAKSRVQRGRAQLRRMLDECCTFEFDRRGGVIGCEPRTRKPCRSCVQPGSRGDKDPAKEAPRRRSRLAA